MLFRKALLPITAVLVLAFAAVGFGKASHAGWPRINTSTEHFYKSTSKKGVTKTGTDGSDELLGYHGSDKLYGAGGADVIWGDWKPNNPKSQRDYLDGGPGDDFIYASRGKSTLIGGDGDDYIKARDGSGTIDCGPGNDVAVQSKKRRKYWKIVNCEKISYNLEK
jgi:Ca2+-binding RTX toxin-like protein